MSDDLRSKVIRLAHERPELRGDLLPLIREARTPTLMEEALEKYEQADSLVKNLGLLIEDMDSRALDTVSRALLRLTELKAILNDGRMTYKRAAWFGEVRAPAAARDWLGTFHYTYRAEVRNESAAAPDDKGGWIVWRNSTRKEGAWEPAEPVRSYPTAEAAVRAYVEPIGSKGKNVVRREIDIKEQPVPRTRFFLKPPPGFAGARLFSWVVTLYEQRKTLLEYSLHDKFFLTLPNGERVSGGTPEKAWDNFQQRLGPDRFADVKWFPLEAKSR